MPRPAVKATRPIQLLKKSIRVSPKEFIKATSKAGASLIFGKWESLTSSAVDAISALGLKSTPGEIAWLLIYRGLLRAIKQTAEEALDFNINEDDLQELHEMVGQSISSTNFSIDKKFFDHPEHSAPLVRTLEAYQEWIQKQGISQQAARSISQRTRSYIAFSLHEEWSTSPDVYAILKNTLETPFTNSNERAFGWSTYYAWLRKQVDQPVFLDSFGLNQIYIPLRAYYRKKNSDSQEQTGRTRPEADQSKYSRVVVDLHTELDSWIDKADRRDPIRLVSGGPGSGKSSFAKIFAAYATSKDSIHVLLIPLHLLDIGTDVLEAIEKFVKTQNFLTVSPLDWDQGEQRVLIIFDGLDELSMQGKVGERNAQEFVRQVIQKSDHLNSVHPRIQIIITGRELSIQANDTLFRKEGQILHILPYLVERKNQYPESYSDPRGLLKADQRNIWWKKYAELTGSEHKEIPKDLDKGNLVEITSQPLLNYLVAIALRRGQLYISGQTNLNSIYADLLRAIYERGWSQNQHPTLKGLTEVEFTRILEEIALASWHGDGRTTTVKEINNHCAQSGLLSLLDRFQEGLESDPRSGITQLLTAFYFRQSGHNTSGERTFEFTHKSFAEYLISRRILRELRHIDRKLRQNQENLDEGLNPREALERWINIAGQTPIDSYIMDFLRGEFTDSDAKPIQETLCRLFSHVQKHGLPIERLSPRPTYSSEVQISRNSERALLISLNAAARLTESISQIAWPTPTSFGEMVKRLSGQRSWDHDVIFNCLSHLDVRGSILINQDFWQSDFQNSDLSNTNLVGSDFRYSDLSGCNLKGAILVYGNFIGTVFHKAKIGSRIAEERAEFTGDIDIHTVGDAVPDKCFLDNASFMSADLEGLAFVGVDLRQVDFTDANMKNTDLSFSRITDKQALLVKALGAKTSLSKIMADSDKSTEHFRYRTQRKSNLRKTVKHQA